MKKPVVLTLVFMVVVILIGFGLFLGLRARMNKEWEAVDCWTETEMTRSEFALLMEDTSNRINGMDSTERSQFGPQLDEIAQHSLQVIRFLNRCEEDLGVFADIDMATLEPMNKRETELNYRYWMFPEETSGSNETDLSNGGRGAGKAIELKGILDDYVDWSNGYLSTLQAAGIAKEASPFESLAPSTTPGDINSTWEFRTFGSKGFMNGRTLVENLQTLANLKREIASMHYEFVVAILDE